MAVEDSDIQRLSHRLARAESLIALLIAKPWEDTFKGETLYRLERLLRESRKGNRDDDFLYLDLVSSLQEAASRREGLISDLSDQGEKLNRLSDKLSIVSDEMEHLRKGLQEQTLNETEARRELHAWLALGSLNVDTTDIPFQRYIPLKLYLSEDESEKLGVVKEALAALAEAAGFEIADELPGVRGSWYQKFFAKTKEVATSPEVVERLAKLEKAAELQGMNKPLAEIDLKYVQALEGLAKATEGSPNAAIQLGSFLYLKITKQGKTAIMARTLSTREILELEKNPDLLKSPHELEDHFKQLAFKDFLAEQERKLTNGTLGGRESDYLLTSGLIRGPKGRDGGGGNTSL